MFVIEHPRFNQKNQNIYLHDRSGGQRGRRTTWDEIFLVKPGRASRHGGITGIHKEGAALLPNHHHTTKVLSWLLENVGSPMFHDLTVITNKRGMNVGFVRNHKLILKKRNPENLTRDCQLDPDRSQMEEPLRIAETWHGVKHGDKKKEPHRMTVWNRLNTTTYVGKSESLQNNLQISRPASNAARTKRGYRERPAKPAGPAPTPTLHRTPPYKITHHIITDNKYDTGITYKCKEEGQEQNNHDDTPTAPQFHDRRSKWTPWSRCEEKLRGEGQEEYRWTKDQHEMEYEKFRFPICNIVICNLICI